MISVELKNKQRFDLAKAGFYYADEKHEMIGLHLVTDKAFNEIQDIFSNAENTEILKIIADENFEMETYQGFTELGNQFKIETDYQDDKQLICLNLKKPILDYESRDDMEFAMMYASENMTDEEAVVHMTLYKEWTDFIGLPMKKGQRFRYDSRLWKTNQNIDKVLSHQIPGIETAALYTVIDEKSHSGTLGDPIPAFRNMEYEFGKYYVEADGQIYLCNRDGGKIGDTYTLNYLPSELINQYFMKVEKEVF